MPDTKITSARIREHLRRMWAAYLVGAVLALFFNHLIFTLTRPSFSEDETLRIMLLNADVTIDEAALLDALQPAGVKSVQMESLISAGQMDAAGAMLVKAKLISGNGDLYITDAAGLKHLEHAGAFADASAAVPCGDGIYLLIPDHAQNTQQAQLALPIMKNMLTE